MPFEIPGICVDVMFRVQVRLAYNRCNKFVKGDLGYI